MENDFKTILATFPTQKDNHPTLPSLENIY